MLLHRRCLRCKISKSVFLIILLFSFSFVTLLDYLIKFSSFDYNVESIKAMLPFIRSFENRDEFTQQRIHIDWKSKSAFDTSENYKIISYIRIADNWSQLDKTPLCVGLHSTLDGLNLLVKFTQTWSGPISLSIFGAGPELDLTEHYIEYLTKCYPDIAKNVAFHFVFPVYRPPSPVYGLNDTDILDCSKSPDSILKKLLEMTSFEFLSWKKQVLYPHNLLRNEARARCQSPWFIDLDIDIIFPNLEKTQLFNFLNSDIAQNCEKCAFVLPIFEVNSTKLPNNKSDLKILISKHDARTYMSTVFNPSHSTTAQETKWLEASLTSVNIAYKVDFNFKYEPYFITKRGAPRFDERYMQNGMDRDSLTYEMHLAGYTFQVLDNIFLLHPGYPKNSEFSGEYGRITAENVNKFEILHHRELAAKYDKDPFGFLDDYKNRNHQNYTVHMSIKP